jgi:hypothetical protein
LLVRFASGKPGSLTQDALFSICLIRIRFIAGEEPGNNENNINDSRTGMDLEVSGTTINYTNPNGKYVKNL